MKACQDGVLVRRDFVRFRAGIDAANETGETFDERGVGVPAELECAVLD